MHDTVALLDPGAMDYTAGVGAGTRAGVTTVYTYDVDGNRLSRTGPDGTTRYLVDPEAAYAQVVEERGGNGVLLARYDAPDDLLQMNRRGWNIYYYLADGLNSTRQLLDGSGNVTDTYAFAAFGQLLGSSVAPTPNPFGFICQRWDQAAGSY